MANQPQALSSALHAEATLISPQTVQRSSKSRVARSPFIESNLATGCSPKEARNFATASMDRTVVSGGLTAGTERTSARDAQNLVAVPLPATPRPLGES